MSVEVQDIFAAYFDSYAASHSLTSVQWKAARAIMNCRTAALGAHIDTCDRCGFTEISYNSCQNRHCPKCQTFAKEEWVDKQRGNLLNTHYFQAVFTVPSELNRPCIRGDNMRATAKGLGYNLVVPPKKNRIDPWKYDEELNKRRNEVDRF